MNQKGSSGARRPVAGVVFTVVIVAIGLGVFGCGEQMARIDEQQGQLQMMVKANSLQIEEIAGSLEKSQQQLHVAIEGVQNNVAKVAADLATLAETQVRLHETVQSNIQQVSGKIAAIGQDQKDLSAGLGRAIADVRSETRKVAADLTSVTAEQVKLNEIVQENNLQLTNKVAAIEQTQQDRQNTIGGMQDNIQAVAASISALGEDVLKLQEILQSNIRELVSIADITGQKQAEFQESVRKNMQTLDESLASLKASQDSLQSRIQASQDDLQNRIEAGQKELQSRIEQMQNETSDLRDVPAAIDQLREQLEGLSSSQRPADDFGAIEYETSAAATAVEANSIE